MCALSCAGAPPLGDEQALRALHDLAGDAASTTGTVTSATSASVGEIENIIASTPTTVSSEISSWLIVCCRVWLTLSMSLVTRRQQLAARLPVEVAQRQPVDLVLDVGAHPAHGALHDAVEHEALQPGEQRRRRRTPRARAAARAPTAAKSTPWPGTTSIRGSMSASLSSPLGAQRRRPPRPWWCPRGCRPNRPEKIRSVAWPRIRGPTTLSADADDGEQRPRRRALPRSGRIRRDQPLGRRAEGHATSGRPCRRPSGRRGPGRRRRWIRSVSFSWPSRGLGGAARWSRHAASSAVSWDSTISW